MKPVCRQHSRIITTHIRVEVILTPQCSVPFFLRSEHQKHHVSSYSHTHVHEHKVLTRLVCDSMSHRTVWELGPRFCFTHTNKCLRSTVCRVARPPTGLSNWNKIEETYINAKSWLWLSFCELGKQ